MLHLYVCPLNQINSKGGNCIPVQCDHGNDNDVDKLFKKITEEQDGRLDILVNNAFGGVSVCFCSCLLIIHQLLQVSERPINLR